MEAALELFTEFGFYRTTMSMIAAKAGVSVGLFYNYFKNKDDLLENMISENCEKTKLGLAQLRNIDDPFSLIEQFCYGLYHIQDKKMQQVATLSLCSLIQPDYPQFARKETRDIAQQSQEFMTEVFRQTHAENPKLEAMLFGAMMSGIRIQYLISDGEYPLEEMIESMIQKFTKNKDNTQHTEERHES